MPVLDQGNPAEPHRPENVDIPSKTILAFTTAARVDSYRAADRELGWTDGACHDQVRRLEKIIGKRLFNWHPDTQRISLTFVGSFLRPVLQARHSAHHGDWEMIRSYIELADGTSKMLRHTPNGRRPVGQR